MTWSMSWQHTSLLCRCVVHRCLTLKLKALQSLPMLVTVYQSTQHNITEDLSHQQNCSQNLTCHSCDRVVLMIHTPSFDSLTKHIRSIAAQQWCILQKGLIFIKCTTNYSILKSMNTHPETVMKILDNKMIHTFLKIVNLSS
jgi:hypothetical protein